MTQQPSRHESEVIITEGRESPSLKLGPQRLHYQFSVTVPQAHLTFVSVLQGIALGVLLLNIPLPPDSLTLSTILPYLINSQHLYLPFVLSALLILMIWKEFVQASMYLNWPLTVKQLGLTMLIAVVEIMAFRAIDNLVAWLIGIGLIGMVGGIIHWNNLKIQAPTDYDSRDTEKSSRVEERAIGWKYFILGLLIISGTVTWRLSPLYSDHLTVGEWIVLLALAAIVGVALVIDSKYSKEVLASILKGKDEKYKCDLRVTKQGGLTYESTEANSSPDVLLGTTAAPEVGEAMAQAPEDCD